MENVEEFQTWGPVRKGKPVKSKAGETFHRWVEQLQSLGYEVEWRELVASDYGAPTTRKRFFLIARRDGCPIAWPEPTHAPADSLEVKAGVKKPWRSAAEIINWGLPTPSIFASKKEIREQYGISAVRPLARNTLRRVARGVDKFVIRSKSPFLVTVGPAGEFHGQEAEEPFQTTTVRHVSGAADSMMLPFTATNTTNSVGAPANQPVHTVTSAGNQLLIIPKLAPIGEADGEDHGQKASESAAECVICPAMVQYHTEQSDYVRAQPAQVPLMTVDAANRYGLATACMVKYYGSTQHGQEVGEPLHTITARDREGLTAVSLAKYFGNVVGTELSSPLPTVTAVDHNALQAVQLLRVSGDSLDALAREHPDGGRLYSEITSVVKRTRPETDLRNWPKIRALLNEFCGYHLQEDEVLLFTIRGGQYFMADIGLRMLTPRELYRANGFPSDYIIEQDYTGRSYGRGKQVARCGNAVPPPFAEALVKANLPEWCNNGKISTMRELEGIVAV